MSVVPYCIVEASGQIAAPESGVSEARVLSLESKELRGFYSELPALAPGAQVLQSEAVRFHRVISAIFSQAAVVQFRFPTLLESAHELREHLERHAAQYRDFLVRVRDLLQMEIRVALPASDSSAASGREYLVNKQMTGKSVDEYAQKLFSTAADLIREWKVRRTQTGIRCYALIARRDAMAFRQRIQPVLSSTIGSGLVSGPWPATEFLDATLES